MHLQVYLRMDRVDKAEQQVKVRGGSAPGHRGGKGLRNMLY